MKIGLYGGTFNPIHHGHLILAREALEQLGLDRVIFLPAKISPFKLSAEPAPAELRARLLSAALQNEPGLTWDPYELESEIPSYTIHTVRAMKDRYPTAKLYYFIGEDHVSNLPKWKNYEELIQLVQFVVLARGIASLSPIPFPVIERRVDISATDIRNRISKNRSIRYLLPDAVREIVEKSGCYG